MSAPQVIGKGVFEDIGPTTGIDFSITKATHPLSIMETSGHGGGMLDYDGDGLLDIVLVGPDHVALYKNLGGFKFKEVTVQSGLRQGGYWEGVAVGDYDNDGKPDLYLCGYNCSALYHNDGNGHFTEVTAAAGLAVRPPDKDGVPEWRTSAGFIDVDNDGKLDLYICRYAVFGPHTIQLCGDPTKKQQYSCSPDIYVPQTGSLYRNQGGGKFKDVTKAMGMDAVSGRALGVAFGDFNDDGWIDIALANDERPGDLLVNQGGKHFINRGDQSGTAVNANGHAHGGMGVDWGDFDGDGKLDLFVATYENESKCLYRNAGHGVFMEASLDAGISELMDRWVAFGCKFLDYDLDGSLDLMVTNGHVMNNTADVFTGTQYRQPLQLFHNVNGVYQEVTSQMGPNAKRMLIGRALIVGDLDNDGKPDVVVTQNEGPTLVLKNMTETTNHWFGLQLVGKHCNRDGFGARVIVTAQGRRQVRDATNSGSFLAAHDPRQIYGLGQSVTVDRVEVRWPGGKTQFWTHLAADHYYRFTEGESGATPVPMTMAARNE